MKVTVAKPKVSIVIPVYNGSNYLKQAIDSALAQTYGNLEIIVVNDGSRDGGATERIAELYGDKIRYFRKENGGVASTLNFGIQQMTGDYFSWLSHDDLYEKTKVEDQVDLMTSLLADDVIVVSNARSLLPNGIKKEGRIDKKTFKYFDIFLATSANVGINGCALLIPRKALIESGGFNPDLPVTQDYDLWYRLSSKHAYKFVLLEKNLVIYRIHEEQDSIRKQILCRDAGDDLHSRMLRNIAYARFEEYFMDDRENLKHAWGNYMLYRTRGFRKTASLLLKNILRYYHEHDVEKFYEIFYSEVETVAGGGNAPRKSFIRGKHGLTDIERRTIDVEYARMSSDAVDLPIKEALLTDRSVQPKGKLGRVVWRIGESLKRDGIYLTGEKLARKARARLTKNRH